MQHKQHNRIFTYVASVATVAIAAALIAVGVPAASAVDAAPRTINVSGVITAFTPRTINVTAGETVSICLTSSDIAHDLTIPTLNNFQVVAAQGARVCKTLTVPTATGSSRFICSISGHEQAGMVGNLVVAAGTGGGGGAPAPAPAPGAGGTPGGGAPQADPPVGGVQTGGGSTAGLTHDSLLMLGGGLLIAAMMSALLGLRVTRKD